MSEAPVIFELRSSLEDDRPEINLAASSKVNDNGAALEEPYCANGPLTVVSDDAEALNWDCYACSGISELLSARAIEALRRDSFRNHELLPATLNRAPYFLPRCIAPIDCLDRTRSVWRPFPSNPQRAMSIDRYSFVMDRIVDPLVFSIPERLSNESFCALFVTQSIKRAVESAGLRGFRFIKLQ